jgi:maleylacetate reductase
LSQNAALPAALMAVVRRAAGGYNLVLETVDNVKSVEPGPSAPLIERRGLEALGERLGADRRRVFVICGASARHVERLDPALSGRERHLFAEARRHVPASLVERAGQALRAFGADAVVALGGGSATGLAKALRLDHQFFFVAVPTTYAGSELTDIYGTTSEGGKRTGRDARVVPDVALYDLELTLDMPLGTTVTSLMNALAHPASALSTGKLQPEGAERALAAAQAVYAALTQLGRDPRDVRGRRSAIDGTILAGQTLRSSPLGAHHELAHALGGRFDLDHAGLHSVLLPHSLARLARVAPGALAALESRLGDGALARSLFRLLAASGAPTSLAALGADRAGIERLIAERPELPADTLERAWAGLEPG